MFINFGLLSKIEKIEEYFFYRTMNGTIGTVLKVTSIDVESMSDHQTLKLIRSVVQILDSDLNLKWKCFRRKSEKKYEKTSRCEAVHLLGHCEELNYLIVEIQENNSFFGINKWTKKQQILLEFVTAVKGLQIELGQSGEVKKPLFSPASQSDIEKLFISPNLEITKYPDYLVIEQELVSYVRIKTNTEQELSSETLAVVKSKFHYPLTILTSVQKMNLLKQ